MSLQSDLLLPELGYFDEKLDLTDPATYKSVLGSFGRAECLPSLAFRSKTFSELENEKVWTRDWVSIGLTKQIPNVGDLLPFTAGFHGVHVQHTSEGSYSARFNFHQHGGCRFVPEQCRTGKQTKCSITSCNYTRDAREMAATASGENSPEMYKFVGINPDKLRAVRFETVGPLIFVNLDPKVEEIESRTVNTLIKIFDERASELVLHKWLDFKCNWKAYGSEFIGAGSAYHFPSLNSLDECPSAIAGTALARDTFEFASDPLGGEVLQLLWVFPNTLIASASNHVAVIVVQSTGMHDTLCRFSLLMGPNSINSSDAQRLADGWMCALQNIGAKAERLHQCVVGGDSSVQDSHNFSESKVESNFVRYIFNKYIIKRILTNHELYWDAPIMDARMMQRRGSK